MITKPLVIGIAAGTVFLGSEVFGMSLTGDVNMVHPPASVRDGDSTNNNRAVLFTEQANTVLGGNLRVDAFLPGQYENDLDAKGRTLGAGRAVSSFLLHADPAGKKSGHMSGSIHFNDKILGVVFGDLTASNALVGAPETAYGTGAGHGLDADDMFRISKDRKRLDFNFNVNGVLDQIRIITRGDAVSPETDGAGNALPEPVTPTLVAMGLTVLALRRRRVDHGQSNPIG